MAKSTAVTLGDDHPSLSIADLKAVAEAIGALATVVSVVAAALIYFGAISARVEARFFGLDSSQLDYSNQELLIRSVAPMLGPLTIFGTLAVLALHLNSLVAENVNRLVGRRSVQRGLMILELGGFMLLAAGSVWQWRLGAHHSYWSPIFLGSGAVLLIGGQGTRTMLRQYPTDRAVPTKSTANAANRAPSNSTSPIRALAGSAKLLLGLIILLATFGLTARIAQAEGVRRALDLVANLEQRPTATVLAEEPLTIHHRGVACLVVNHSRFTRRYTGFHLIAYRNSRYYLAPIEFNVNNGVIVVLDDTPDIRVEYDATRQLRFIEGLPATPPPLSPDPSLGC